MAEKVKLEVPVLVRGGVRIEEGANPKITVNEISSLEEAKIPLPSSFVSALFWRRLRKRGGSLHSLFSRRKGDAKVLFDVERKEISWW